MQSKTSYFNAGIFRNSIRRFWPIWLAYTAIWMLLPISQMDMHYHIDGILQLRQEIYTSLDAGLLMSGGFAVLSAMAVWSFVYQPRTVSGITCLPLRRECTFLSVTLAGILPLLAANLLVALLTLASQWAVGYPDLLGCAGWFALISLQVIFFYGFATLCAQLTGNIVVLPAVYVVLNFTVLVVESIVLMLCDEIIYGYITNSAGFNLYTYLSPVVGYMELTGGETERVYLASKDTYEMVDVIFRGWGFYCVYAAVGVLMAVLALLLYRRRHMESAGDVVAVPVLKPVFKYCLAVGSGLVLAAIAQMTLYDGFDLVGISATLALLIAALIGCFIGYFAGEMLNRKSFRAFRGAWRGFGIVCAVTVIVTAAAEFDLFGVERRFPEASEVSYVEVYGGDYTMLAEPENIEDVIQLHKQVVANKSYHEDKYKPYGCSFAVDYVMKNGDILRRQYTVHWVSTDEPTNSDVRCLEALMNSLEAIAYREGLNVRVSEENIISGTVRTWISAEERMEIDPDYDLETHILREYYGYDKEYIVSYMPQPEKDALLEEFYANNDLDTIASMDGYYEYTLTEEEMAELYNECIVPDLAEGLIGRHFIVDSEERYKSIYDTRIDMRFWYTAEEVIQNTTVVYASSTDLYADVAVPVPETRPVTVPEGTDTRNYSITVLTDSARTVQWLRDHGVILHTQWESRNY